MLIDWAINRGLSILATLVFAFAVVPESASAHGNANPIPSASENAAYVDLDTDHVIGPSYTGSHCHSSSGQDCSTQFVFIITSDTLANTTNFDVFVSFYHTLRTD